MFKIELTDEIKEKHRQYFDKNIIPILENSKIEFVDKDIEKINKDESFLYSKDDVETIHNKFIQYCIDNKDIISIGNFEELRKLQKEIDRLYPLVTKLINNFEFSDVNDKHKSEKYWKVLFKLFGYDNFGDCSLFTIVRDSAKNYFSVGNRMSNKVKSYIQYEMIETLKKLFPKIEIIIDNKFENIDLSGKNIVMTMDEFESRLNKLEKQFSLAITLDNYKNCTFYDVWNSYLFVLGSGLRTCSYCNRQYITPILTSNGKMRGTLDHFVAKSKYPYFSMSLYNLIPVCYSCNSSFKGDIEFNFDDISPYEESMDDYIRFYANLAINKPINIHIKTKKIKKEAKAKKYIEVFKLEPQYNYHVNQVEELVLKRLIYSEEYIKDIKYSKLNGFKISEKKLREQLIGYTQEQLKINDEPLSKFRRDIVEQLNFFDDFDIYLINKLEEILDDNK